MTVQIDVEGENFAFSLDWPNWRWHSLAEAPEAAYQVMKYRENLKALKSIMEALQFSLLAEKARLENVRANMQAACAWAASVREIS